MLAFAIWFATAIALLGHALVWTGVVNILHGFRGPRLLIKLGTVLCVAVFAAVPLAAVRWWWLNAPDHANLFLAEGWLGPYAGACAAYGALGFVRKLWVEHNRNDRQTLVEWTAQPRDAAKAINGEPFVGAYARLLGALPGNEVLALTIDRKRLALPRLPAELEGLTIAHLSDFHMTGRVGRGYYELVARAVNELRPDVIAITGDIIESETCWPWLTDTIGSLCAPLGVYYILGNHDLFIDATRTRELLDGSGLTNIGCRWLRAEWNGVAVTLGGNELPWIGPAPSLEQLQRRRPGHPEFRLALCHTPDQFPWCVEADVDLALAGHTHGGQVRVPLLGVVGSPSLRGTRYACGVFRRRDVVLHVSRGLGGQTPVRFHCPPELALLELTTASCEARSATR
jgi:predicted MPP superfamily phosphohydrolase